MVVVSILPHAEIGRNDHREHAPKFKKVETYLDIKVDGQ